MAEISDPQLTDFCNNYLRPLADTLTTVDHQLAGVIGTYNARNLGTIISNAGASNLVTDGSQADGRTRVTGGDVFNLVTLLTDLQSFVTSGRRDVLLKWQVNGVRS